VPLLIARRLFGHVPPPGSLLENEVGAAVLGLPTQMNPAEGDIVRDAFGIEDAMAVSAGAHLNPAVTLVMRLRGHVSTQVAIGYAVAQLIGGIVGVWLAHLMLDVPVLQLSRKIRTGPGQWTGEAAATFGLIITILGTARMRPESIPTSVALYITAADCFTSSTSFANPAITIARSLSGSFAGIAPACVPGFIAAQVVGALAAHFAADLLFTEKLKATT
jgi:glycerol uptake facilitator-like aquaporin